MKEFHGSVQIFCVLREKRVIWDSGRIRKIGKSHNTRVGCSQNSNLAVKRLWNWSWKATSYS